MTALEMPCRRCWNAAEGWLELGNWVEAHPELDRISPPLLEPPDVLAMR
jgi:hypothetical protein